MIDPREIDEVKFETTLRGYSKKEVDVYLDELKEKIAAENQRYSELERKYAALKIQIEDIKSTAEEEHAENERIRAEAEAELARAREEADRITAGAREGEKQTALRAKFEADKSIAAAKREAMLIADEAKQKAHAVELASHRAADKVIGDAKREAAEITRSAKTRGEEMVLNAQASVEGERRLFMKLREEIIACSGELSKLLTGQLTDIADFADRVRRTSFDDIPTDREELLDLFADGSDDVPAADAEESEKVTEASEVAEEVAPKEYESAVDEDDDTYAEEEIAEETVAKADDDDDSDDMHVLIEDDDTYDFAGYTEDKGIRAFEKRGDVLTEEHEGLPNGKRSRAPSGEGLSDEELNRIFSFDVEEILNNDNY